ncbi:MAG: hypothetical protein F6J93_12840 [Oscillatoria sp. SIO1A7]|nr:hypothetical protein [Oscillatoria sp. SIO1A7]
MGRADLLLRLAAPTTLRGAMELGIVVKNVSCIEGPKNYTLMAARHPRHPIPDTSCPTLDTASVAAPKGQGGPTPNIRLPIPPLYRQLYTGDRLWHN